MLARRRNVRCPGTLHCILRSWPQARIVIVTAKRSCSHRLHDTSTNSQKKCAAQMRNLETKRMTARFALTYDRLAEFAVLREASDQNETLAGGLRQFPARSN